MDTKPEIAIEDLDKLDIRVGTIIKAAAVEGSDKLMKLTIDFGELGMRTILTGMRKFHDPKDMENMQTTFLVNLKPRKMMGMESQGMILALGLEDDTKPIFLIPKDAIKNGEGVR